MARPTHQLRRITRRRYRSDVRIKHDVRRITRRRFRHSDVEIKHGVQALQA